ncbi:MAG TPA: ammonium transporter [bacterium]|nr:ammonium transporter [bacterium]
MPTPNTINSGDTAFVLLCTALVLFMTPGLAFFYGGLVRGKNMVNTLLMSFIAVAIVGVQWVLIGYSLSFAPGSFLLGSLRWFGLEGVGGDPYPDLAATIPHSAFMLFQAMFAVITPALISGAVVERVKFKSWMIFLAVWSTLVYAPICHWVWAPDGWLHNLGALDFAGGTVVHISAGIAALIAAIMVGPRLGHPKLSPRPHNVPFCLLGAGLLAFGWLGFNGGSALGANGLAATAFVTSFTAAAMAGLAWAGLEMYKHGRVTGVGVASGIVAGLVGITPAAGFVSPIAALAIGLGAAGVSFAAVQMKSRFGYDDSLDVFGVHGMAGIFGALATGVFASAAVNPAGANGLLHGNGMLVLKQLAGIGATLAWSGVFSFAILKAIDVTVGLRVEKEAEQEGLDLAENGELAYGESSGTVVTPVEEESVPVGALKPAFAPSEF